MPPQNAIVIGISAVSGGGKTRVASDLARSVVNASAVYFDDFDDTTEHPPDLRKWLADGGDYNAWQAPVLAEHLGKLKTGKTVGPDGSPLRHIVFDAPLGRAHAATGNFIDHMVFLDTPLDIALARRLLRDGWTDDTKGHLRRYLDWTKELFTHHIEQVAATADLVLDGTLPADVLVERIIAEFGLPGRMSGSRPKPA